MKSCRMPKFRPMRRESKSWRVIYLVGPEKILEYSMQHRDKKIQSLFGHVTSLETEREDLLVSPKTL